jgi:hypothetical protein
MNDLEREFNETKLSRGHINSDREGRFDSLRDVLNPERSDSGDPAREYAERHNHDETLSRILDR